MRWVMRSLVVRSGLLAMSSAAGLFLWSRPAWLFLTTGAVGAAFWWLGRCHHPRPLGLLPIAKARRIGPKRTCPGCPPEDADAAPVAWRGAVLPCPRGAATAGCS